MRLDSRELDAEHGLICPPNANTFALGVVDHFAAPMKPVSGVSVTAARSGQT